MSGRIPQSFIDQLLDRTDIVEVIDAAVKLKKSGRNYSACCPFHQEKTPSFSVSPDKQFYYCFGCGAGGNALGFLMAHEHLPFVEAVERLARRAGLDVPREQLSPQAEQQQRRERTLYDRLAELSEWYYSQLKNSPEAIHYLKKRGISGKTARDYRIGFAPAGWDNVLKRFGTDDAALHELIESGMVVEGEDSKRYDRFRHRVMFPIRDGRGRVIAFGGRVLGDDKPKYLNSPETPVFHKSRELYGLFEARLAGASMDRLLVVEGYMDVVMLAEHGIHQAVATLGTAVGRAHLERLFRHTSEVIFCFDGDNAGLKAAHRALEVSLPTLQDGRMVRFMFLPDGEDPDSLVQKEGRAAFAERIAHAEPLSAFLLRTAATGQDSQSPDGRARIARNALALIAQVPAGLFRSLLIAELAKQTGLDAHRMEQQLGGHDAPPTPPRERPEPPPPQDAASPPAAQRSPQLGAAHQAMGYLLFNPQLAAHANPLNESALAALDSPDTELLLKLIAEIQARPDSSVAGLLSYWGDAEERSLLARLATYNPLLTSHEALRHEFIGCLARLAQEAAKRPTRQLQAELAEGLPLNYSDLSPEQKQRFQALFQPKADKNRSGA
ncbi:MAG TPA: DNA primase [Pseudomonadales bacterium]|jgi:DNA primase